MQDITIAEGEVARTMGQVAKLVTNLQGGGMCAWVPEDERKTATKHITENGAYNPADDDVYGYSKVTVRVPQGVSGTAHGVTGGFDVDDGEEYFIENVDGNLVFTEVPASIAVTTPPTKTSYNDGDNIDFSGIMVTAYHADGSVFDTEDYPGGVIPFDELMFSETIARIGSMQVPVQWHRFGDDQTLEATFPITVTPFEGWGDNTGDGGSTSGGGGF